MKLYLITSSFLTILATLSLVGCSVPSPALTPISASPATPTSTATPAPAPTSTATATPAPTPTSVSQTGDTVNLVRALSLSETTQIDIINLLQPPAAGSASDANVITDPDELSKIIDSLDVDLPLRPRSACDAVFVLRFRLADGRIQEFDYGCNPGSPDFLRGFQKIWSGQEALTPSPFNALMAPYLRASFNNPSHGMPPDETPPATPSQG